MQLKFDITGKRFGRLLVLFEIEGTRWLCRCDCGNVTRERSQPLRIGKTRSCGCLSAEQKLKGKHGHSRTALYSAFMAMHQRCENPNNEAYEHYGARGIRVCARWDNFGNFIADMGERPKGMTLDREKNDLGYSKENCRWVTHLDQQSNRRDNQWITFNGRTQTLSQWARELSVPTGTLHKRIKNWPLERALKANP